MRDRVRGEDEGECTSKNKQYYDEKEAFAFHHFTDAYEKAEE